MDGILCVYVSGVNKYNNNYPTLPYFTSTYPGVDWTGVDWNGLEWNGTCSCSFESFVSGHGILGEVWW